MATLEAPAELKDGLQAIANEVFKPRGSVLFRRGEAVSGMFLVRSGKVKLGLGCENSAYASQMVGTGALVGLPATMSGAPYSLTAEVMQDAHLGFVAREAVLELLRKDSRLSFQVMQLLSEEISGMRTTLKQGAVPPARCGRQGSRIPEIHRTGAARD